ncbi:hypothetical protein RRG08_038612 [Elysia crispata]|uniref:Uncharacterized protein n=1 Tax=Elysia crispata TaxID=231223 RepID=A0AAE1D0I7_9GAST|nr:hypothetical protein RRG08_038612 [Elysia crispata]
MRAASRFCGRDGKMGRGKEGDEISFRTIQNASCAIDLTVPTGRNVISASASHPTCQLSPSGESCEQGRLIRPLPIFYGFFDNSFGLCKTNQNLVPVLGHRRERQKSTEAEVNGDVYFRLTAQEKCQLPLSARSALKAGQRRPVLGKLLGQFRSSEESVFEE